MPPVVNDRDTTRRALAAAQAALGIDKVMTEFPPSTAGDDFAMFSQEVPGAYVWLGNGPAVDGALHHNSHYDFNDDALASGVKFWTTLVEQELAA
jgi:metal-dependent amidase/aminoacylase/carboxypeptidase family protein